MGVRFRKRIRLAPGLHLNVSGSGLSLSAGPRGASMTFGSRGTFLNSGIPGTGLYSRGRIDEPGAASTRTSNSDVTTIKMSVTISVEDDGTLVFRDNDGTRLPEYLVKQAKEQQKEAIHGLIESTCAEINGSIDALEQIHFATPAPDDPLAYTMQPFDVPKPDKPVPRKQGVMGFLFGPSKDRVDEENAEALAVYETKMQEWSRELQKHGARELAHKTLIEKRVLTELPAMEIVLEESLKDISWPRETTLSTEIRDDGRVVMVDIDLPEIEDLPRKTAAVPSRGWKLSIKEIPVTRHQQLYMRHIHGIGFRIIGEIFSVLPKADEVVLSTYTQRPDKATGDIMDKYLYSVRVNRGDWATINFDNLENVDAAEALGRFDIRREVTKTGIFKEIVPFDGGVSA